MSDLMQQRDDWARVVLGWVKDAERQADEAFAVGDGPGYTAAIRWRDQMRSALRVIDPTAELRFAMQEASGAMRRFGYATERAMRAASDAAERARKGSVEGSDPGRNPESGPIPARNG